ncbi:MAG: hypothetical protein AB7O52_07025 [Planctomycetota bacterium]
MRTPAALLLSLAVISGSTVTAQDSFIRGDTDGDGRLVVVLDAARLSAALFGGGLPLACEDAGDVDDNGVLELADLALLLNEFTAPGTSIAPPFPSCGTDNFGPPDTLTCAAYHSCLGFSVPVLPLPAVVLGFSPATGTPGGTVSVTVTADVTIGSYAGWSFGVCHDPGLASVMSVAPGATLSALSPDFDVQQISTMGWRTATLVSSTAATALGTGSDYQLYEVDYADGGMGASPLTICDTLGVTEPVTVVFATVDPIAPVLPVSVPGSLLVATGPPPGSFIRGDADANGVVDFVADAAYLSNALFQAGPGLTCEDAGDFTDDGALDLADLSFMLTFGFEHLAGPVPPPYPECGLDPTADSLDCLVYAGCGGPAPTPLPGGGLVLGFGNAEPVPSGDTEIEVFVDTDTALTGWSLGVCHDPESATLVSVAPGATLTALMPDFEARTLIPGVGWTGAALIRYMGGVTLGPGTDFHLYTAKYCPTGAGDPRLRVCGGLGEPPVRVSFAGPSGAVPMTPTLLPGSVIPLTGRYVRGDANADSIIDLSDAIFVIAWAFADGASPPCFRAADANGDQALDIADMIWLINYLFQSGPDPRPPFPLCGYAGSSLTCVSYPHCP